jgi:hypothetical protein
MDKAEGKDGKTWQSKLLILEPGLCNTTWFSDPCEKGMNHHAQ